MKNLLTVAVFNTI